MRRRRMDPHAFHRPTDEGMERLRLACEFDLDSPPLEWARAIVVRQDALLRGWNLHGDPAALGLRYVVVPDRGINDRLALDCHAFGHASAPYATSVEVRDHPTGDRAQADPHEREWLTAVASWHAGARRVLHEGGDPRRPRPENVVAEPCLARLVAHHGIDAADFLDAARVGGELLVGHGWRKLTPQPRTIAIGDVRAHLHVSPGLIRVERIRLAPGISYDPPDRTRSRLAGILTATDLSLPESMRTALIGQSLSRIVEHPALDPGTTIRTIAKAGRGVTVRVDHREHVETMAETIRRMRDGERRS